MGSHRGLHFHEWRLCRELHLHVTQRWRDIELNDGEDALILGMESRRVLIRGLTLGQGRRTWVEGEGHRREEEAHPAQGEAN